MITFIYSYIYFFNYLRIYLFICEGMTLKVLSYIIEIHFRR